MKALVSSLGIVAFALWLASHAAPAAETAGPPPVKWLTEFSKAQIESRRLNRPHLSVDP